MKKTLSILLAVILAAAFVECGGSGSQNTAMVAGTTAVGDISMAYRIYTKDATQVGGYPLIMIMGLTGTQNIWDPSVIDAFAAQYKVVVFDNRGMGLTTNSSGAYTTEQNADDAAGLMDALGIEKAHVLGWSFGTNIAQELALRHPQKVNKLVLYAADCGGAEAIQPTEEVIRKTMSGTPEEVLETLFPADWLAVNRDYIVNLLSTIVTESSTEGQKQLQYDAWRNWGGCCGRLNQIQSPTLLITGTQDVSTPTANSPMMVELIPDAWLAELPDGGHGIMFQFPARFSGIVLDFLE